MHSFDIRNNCNRKKVLWRFQETVIWESVENIKQLNKICWKCWSNSQLYIASVIEFVDFLSQQSFMTDINLLKFVSGKLCGAAALRVYNRVCSAHVLSCSTSIYISFRYHRVCVYYFITNRRCVSVCVCLSFFSKVSDKSYTFISVVFTLLCQSGVRLWVVLFFCLYLTAVLFLRLSFYFSRHGPQMKWQLKARHCWNSY